LLSNSLKSLINNRIIYIYSFLIYGSLVAGIVIPILVDLEIYYNSPIFSLIIGMGTIEAIFIIISTISLIFWGYVIDKSNRKEWALIGIFIIIVGTILIIFLPNIEYYVVGRWIMGIGLGVVAPVSFSLAGDLIKYENRGIVSGGLSIAILGGSGLAIIAGGLLGALNVFAPFVLIAFISLIIILLIILMPDPIRGQEEPELREFNNIVFNNKFHHRNKLVQYNKSMREIFFLLKRRTNLIMFIQGFFALIPSVILAYYLISFLRDNRYGGIGLSLGIAILLGLGIASGRLLGYIIWGILGDILQFRNNSLILGRGRVLVASITMLIQGPVMILAFLIPLPSLGEDVMFPNFIFENPSFIIFGCVFFVAAFIGGGSGPNRRSLAYDINEPELRGKISSLFSIGDQIGASFGLFIGNILIVLNGYVFAFVILSICYILAGIIWFLGVWTVRKDQQQLRSIMEKRASNYLLKSSSYSI